MKTSRIIIAIVIFAISNMLCLSIGHSIGEEEGQNNCEKLSKDSLNTAVCEELNYFFSDSSYQHLYGHRIDLPEEFGELGAYPMGTKHPLYGWTDDWGTIHIEIVNYGKIDSSKTLSDIDKDEL